MANKPLIILDLDGTCITEANTRHTEFFQVGNDHLTFRPHLFLFLTRLLHDYDFAIWSASEESYVQAVAKRMMEEVRVRSNCLSFAFVFVWSGNRCVRVMKRDGLYSFPIGVYKPLKKVWKQFNGNYSQDNTFIIDDTPLTYQKNYGNARAISTWNGDLKDTAWRQLLFAFV